MVGIAAVAWWPAFTLGAWGELFFDYLMGLWAASVAAFAFVLVERQAWWRRVLQAIALALPTVWLVISFTANTDTEADLATAIVVLSAIAAVIIGIPFTLVVLVRIIWPDFRSETTRRHRWLITAVVGGVVLASYILGLNQAKFLHCEDFDISGNSRPPGCVPFDDATPAGATDG
ncbi:hypothetical protein [Microbacterium telephonicum]|uniref:Uncharacterized protein n=1 Tax=Microbacterium telephonicum TaxID=1714841 RepID=A0A498BRS6_9MICO|nr:hypothetical protein [Microbacterium telephonicum]RLK46625.1 hypothetical protein C7474_2809 [Microbacterium telephonicum]